jgi:hypothetical protein
MATALSNKQSAMTTHIGNGAWAICLAVALLLLMRIPTASAVPIVSIDMDPGTAGIQNSLNVLLGSSFDVSVVITGDGTSAFETAVLEVAFSGAGPVLGLAAGTGSPVAGDLAALAPFPSTFLSALAVIDASTGSPVALGSALDTLTLPSPTTSGLAGLIAFFGPFSTIPAGQTAELFRLTFDALSVGSSQLSASAGLLGGLALAGTALTFDTQSGTVSVTDPGAGPTPAPEPSVLMLLSTGLLSLVWSRRRKRAR